MLKLIALIAVLVAFGVFTDILVLRDGYFGFIRSAGRDPWALQMLLDVSIAISLFTFWMIPDARKHGITPWPYFVACIALGSIGALAYLVHRQVRVMRAAPATSRRASSFVPESANAPRSA